MNDEPIVTTDEQPKEVIAQKLIAKKVRSVVPKRKYFVPHVGAVVSARTPQEAVGAANTNVDEKVGDE